LNESVKNPWTAAWNGVPLSRGFPWSVAQG
jgi:hypothetical protein